jgi:hypothetical protein
LVVEHNHRVRCQHQVARATLGNDQGFLSRQPGGVQLRHLSRLVALIDVRLVDDVLDPQLLQQLSATR